MSRHELDMEQRAAAVALEDEMASADDLSGYAAELVALRSKVAQLPKTEDGEPIVPGMEVMANAVIHRVVSVGCTNFVLEGSSVGRPWPSDLHGYKWCSV